MGNLTRNACITLMLFAGLSGCATRVYVETPAQPNVRLTSASVAIVAADRSCHALANRLAERLTRQALFRVDPKAKVKLLVSHCREQIRPTVNIFQTVDGRTNTVNERREVHVEGRAFAQVEVTTDAGSQAHLIGSAQWSQEAQSSKALRGLSSQLEALVADDLVEQVRPIPRIAERRIFPNAQPGSQKALLTQAVAAEIRGDLPTAIKLAQAAQNSAPNSRIRAYLDELKRRLP